MNNTVFGKTMENARNHRDIKVVTTEARTRLSEPDCHTTKIFSGNLLAIEMKRTQILMSKPFFSGLPILGISKIVRYEINV